MVNLLEARNSPGSEDAETSGTRSRPPATRGHSYQSVVLKEKESLALGEQEILEPQNKHESLERIIPFLAAPNHAQLVCDSYMASNWYAGRDL